MPRVIYCNYGAQETKVNILEPVHLASIDDEWSLAARFVGKDSLLQFALSHVVRATGLARSTLPITFDPEVFFAKGFGHFVGEPGESHKVAVRFSAEAAPGVLGRQWHPAQTTEKATDGSVTLRFPTVSLFEVKRSVLHGGAQVMSALRAEIDPEMRAMQRRS